MLGKILVLFLVWSAVGWACLAIGVIARRNQRSREERERTRATATIVSLDRKPRAASASAPQRVFPVVEFTADGQVYQLQSTIPIPSEGVEVGQPVDVLYDADRPASFHLDVTGAESDAGKGPVRFGVIWIACALVATLVMAYLVGGADLNPRSIRSALRGLMTHRTENKTVTVGDFTYEVRDDGSAMLTGYKGNADVLALPIVIDGRIVTGLSVNAVSRSTTLTSVSVPGTVRSISAGAFAGCINLSTVNVQSGVSSIGMQAFGFCMSLRDVTLPESVTSIAKDAFPEDCSACFHVVEGSEADKYVQEHGFERQLIE